MIKQSWGYRFTLTLLVLAIIIVVNTVGHAQTFSLLYSFGTNIGDPLIPGYEGIVAQGRDGNMYSTAQAGGTFLYGAVFKITPGGHTDCAVQLRLHGRSVSDQWAHPKY